jgi:hypothetical protein
MSADAGVYLHAEEELSLLCMSDEQARSTWNCDDHIFTMLSQILDCQAEAGSRPLARTLIDKEVVNQQANKWRWKKMNS